MNKTKNLILKILEEETKLLSVNLIEERLVEKGRKVTYDTVWRNLKKMFEEGVLIKEARAEKRERKYSWEPKHNPWCFHYQLNQGVQK